MASTGKKGKKSKEKKLSLQDFLAKSGPQQGVGTTQVTVQKFSSWAEECEEDEDRKTEIIQLPTAPRSTRILEDNSIPNDPPFYARVSNLPFDIGESDVDEFFADQNIHIKEMKLARDEANDRLRGFGFLEFETREDLIDAIMLADPLIRNRRIRIEFTMEPDSISGRTMRKRYDNYMPRDSANESTNWRDRKESNFETVDRDNRGDRDRGGDRRRNFQPRSNFQNRHDTNNNSEDSNWRMGEREMNDSPPRRFERNDRRGGDRDRERGGGNRYDREREQRDAPVEERPKLNIAPRTLPLPELHFPKEEELERGTRKISLNGDNNDGHDDSGLPDEEEKEKQPAVPKAAPVPKENIFGLAKPVDTAAKQREIEEKMEQDRLQRMKAEKEKREKESDENAASSSQDESTKKDVIVIRTESSRRQDETNWRKRDENATTTNGSFDNKNRGGNRQIGKSEDRPRLFSKDNRSYNNRGSDRDRGDRDYRSSGSGGGGGMNRDRDRDRRDNRDNNIRRRDHNSFNNEIRREEPPREREPRREKNYDMPKFVENSGPNLKTSNAFAGLDDEVYDD